MTHMPKLRQKEIADLLDAKMAASILGISASTIRHWARTKKLKFLKIGSSSNWRFTNVEVLKMLHAREKNNAEKKILKEHVTQCQKVFLDIYPEHIIRETAQSKDFEKQRKNQQTFLLKLTDALRPLENPLEIQAEATRILGTYLGVGRSFYSEIEADGTTMVIRQDYVDGVSSQIGRYCISDFSSFILEEYRIGRTVVVNNIATDVRLSETERLLYPAVSVEAFVCVPLIKAGRLVSAFSVNQPKPRQWSVEEVTLIVEVAERTWAAVERSRAEQALVESETKYQALFNSIDQGFIIAEVVLDVTHSVIDFRHLEVNPALEQITGIRNVAGKLASEITPHFKSDWLEPFDNVVKTGEPSQFEHYSVDTDRWYQAHLSRLGGSGSRLVGVVFDDITERKNREKNLAFLAYVSECLLQMTNTDEIFRLLCEKIGVHFSVAVVAFLEVDEAEGIATPIQIWNSDAVIIPPGVFSFADYHNKDVLRLMRSGKPEIVRDTATLPLAITKNMAALKIGAFVNTPLERKGEWRLTLSIADCKPRDWRKDELELIADIATRIWTWIERVRSEEALQRDVLQKDQFIGVAAHELKTPVTSIKAYAQVLEHRFRKVGDMNSAGLVQKITTQVNKLTDLIEDLLDVTKIESGKIQYKKQYVNINCLVKEIVEETKLTTSTHTFRLELSENKMVFADHDRLGQVFINLLSNAIKYSSDTKEILIKSVSMEHQVIISVQDFGIGIPKEHQQKIFDRFHRVTGRSKETYPGLGLGLYISEEIIKRHNGHIWVESIENKGSTFFVSLPQTKK